jgi:hypothetical protein
MTNEWTCAEAEAQAKKKAALRAELGKLTVRELKRKARTAGADDDRIEDLDDADDIKAATIDLVMSLMPEEGVPPIAVQAEDAQAAVSMARAAEAQTEQEAKVEAASVVAEKESEVAQPPSWRLGVCVTQDVSSTRYRHEI